MKSDSIFNKAVPFLAFAFGLWYFCIRILGNQFNYIPGDWGDSRFINFLLEHGHRWITGTTNGFWNAEFMYPFHNTIALSDSMLGTLPLYSIWRFMGFSPETAYQLWWICICVLNYWVSYIIFKKWFHRKEIATILAWIFAFTIFNLGQLNYMQMIIRFMVPVVFYAAYRMIESPSLKHFAIFCFGIVFQFYCCVYTGFYLLYFSGLFVIIYYLISKKWRELRFYFQKGTWMQTALVVVLAGIALFVLMYPYLNMSKVVGLRRYAEVKMNLPVWKSFLFPTEATTTWNFLYHAAKPDVSEWWLQYLFVGLLPLLTLIITPFYLIYTWYKKIETPLLVKTLAFTAIVLVLLHLRTHSGLTLYAAIFKLPGINSMRVLTRFMHVELFLLLLLFGYFLTRIKPLYLLPIAVLVIAENSFSSAGVPRQEKLVLEKRKQVLLAELQKLNYKKYKAVALLDTSQMAYVTHLDMMLVSQELGVKTINGYSSYCPDAFGEFFLQANNKGLERWLNDQHLKREDVLIIDRNRKP